MNLTHEQAQALIEQPAQSLNARDVLALHRHLDACSACRGYYNEFYQRENLIRNSLQTALPRPHFSQEKLRQISKFVQRQARPRRLFNWLTGGIQNLTWVGFSALLVFGLVWLLNNLPVESSEPAVTALILPTDTPLPTPLAQETIPDQITPTVVPTSIPPLATTLPVSDQSQLTLDGHHDRVTTVTFSPDGELLASADASGVINVWRVRDLFLLYSLEAHTKSVTSLVFSPDGNTFATGGKDGKVHMWLAKSGAFLHTLLEDPGWIKSLAYSPDGELLAVSLNEYRVWVFDPDNSRMINGSTAYTRFDVSTTTTNNYILASSETAVWLSDVSDLPFGLNLRGQGGKSLDAVLSPDGSLLASGSTDQKIYLWQVYDVTYLLRQAEEANSVSERHVFGSLETVLEGHTGWVNSIAFSPDQQYLISGAGDGTLKIWFLSDGTLSATLTGHQAGVNSVDVSPDGRLIASASDDGTIKFWNLAP